MDFLLTFETIGILLAMAIPGFIIIKLKLIDANSGIKVLSVFLLYICQPFITVNAFLNTEFQSSILINIVFVLLITTILMIMLLFIGKSTFHKDKLSQRGDVYSFASSLGNVGYIAIPFLQVLTNNNSEIILYATSSLVAFNFVAWTIGCYFISKDKKHISLKNAVFNLPTISFLIVLPFFILNLNFIRFPQLHSFANASNLFANMMAPVSMTILGMQFAKMKFLDLFNDYRAYIACAIKLLLSPIIAIGLYYFFNIFVDLSVIKFNIVVLSAMPAGTLVMMFSSIYNSDTKSAARIVLLSTLISIITIPLVLTIFI